MAEKWMLFVFTQNVHCPPKIKTIITARENCKALTKIPDYGHKTILSASKCL